MAIRGIQPRPRALSIPDLTVPDWDWGRLIRDGYALFSLAVCAAILTGRAGLNGLDAHAYWAIELTHLYGSSVGQTDAYLYSPAFAQLIAPLTGLAWPLFQALVTAANLAALYLLLGRWAIPSLVLFPIALELHMANVNLLMALALFYGFRHPWTWSFILLTKVTPGVGLLWFAVRREWRHLAIALGATTVVASTSWVLAPGLWVDWMGLLVGSALGPTPTGELLGPSPIPLSFRLAVAACVVIVGARTDRPQTVAIAAAIGQPVIWGWSIAIAALPLMDWRAVIASFRKLGLMPVKPSPLRPGH
jgi:hypothetical protein